MKFLLSSLTLAAAMLLATADTAQAQWYTGTPYARGYSPYYSGYTPYYSGYSPFYGSYYGSNYYPGGYGVQTFSYDTTLPGGGSYGYSFRRPGYYAAYRSPSYGYAYPGYYYRPGYYIWFNN